MRDRVRVVTALPQRLRDRREGLGRLLGERLPGLARPQPLWVRERPLEPIARRRVGQVVQAEFVGLADAVVQLVRMRNRSMSETISSGGFSSAKAYSRSCPNAALRSFRFPLYSQAK